MTLPMLRIYPSPWDFKMSTFGRANTEAEESAMRDKFESLRKLSMVQLQPPRNPNKPFTSFRINDILSATESRKQREEQQKQQQQQQQQQQHQQHQHVNRSASKKLNTLSQRHFSHHSALLGHDAIARLDSAVGFRRMNNNHHRHLPSISPRHHHHNNNNNHHRLAASSRIVRPWDTSPSPAGRSSEASSDADEEINVDEEEDEPITPASLKDVSPLDALMEMANKTFQGLETSEAADAKRREQAALFGKHSAPKKRRKSRTAFTNQQIYELEKRFLYQKYLTPADRDEIAQHLGLSNAQVITWFQNRRAKLKRDLEELKNDVVATKQISIRSGQSEHEFDIDSDTDSVQQSSQTPQKRFRSDSQSLDDDNGLSSPRSTKSVDFADDTYESPSEIVVDDKDDIINKSEEKDT